MSNVTTTYADDYFEDERLNTGEWDDNPSMHQAALNMAENQLESIAAMDYTNEQHKKAVCEQALFLLQYGDGADRRGALQAMGVISAGVVQEVYKRTGVALAPYAARVLEGVLLSPAAFLATKRITRDDCTSTNFLPCDCE